ncbi:MAG: hypothetical protein M2R45_05345 [Verrucomicrobia subdivision 3 bacterium]|nr:hypothetical protein [Limisphaerales bacterium]MCS1417841.1 hypothetical protein [Limisphaerales bacterium]
MRQMDFTARLESAGFLSENTADRVLFSGAESHDARFEISTHCVSATEIETIILEINAKSGYVGVNKPGVYQFQSITDKESLNYRLLQIHHHSRTQNQLA